MISLAVLRKQKEDIYKFMFQKYLENLDVKDYLEGAWSLGYNQALKDLEECLGLDSDDYELLAFEVDKRLREVSQHEEGSTQ